MLMLWARPLSAIYEQTGLFWWLGTDFALYHAQSQALWSQDPGAIYDAETLATFLRQLYSSYAHNTMSEFSVHVPYPPLYAWLFTPFTLLSPPMGFALWESISILAIFYLAWRANQFFSPPRFGTVALMLFVSYPAMTTLISGQPQLLLACAVAEAFLSFRSGKDFRAGLWVACLLFKPQYGVLLGILLIWKRRWHAVAGAVLGGVIIWGGSLAVAGISACLDYPNAFSEMSAFRSDYAYRMINWRSLVIWAWPGISDTFGLCLVGVLGIVTVAVTALASRGPWKPADTKFSAQVSLLLLATLLANYHSLAYGAVILAVPLAAVMGQGSPNLLTSVGMMSGLILPSLAYCLYGGHLDSDDSMRAALLLKFSIVSCFVGLASELLSGGQVGNPGMSRMEA